MTTSLLTAFVVGLLGGVHCVGMCGGVVSMLTLGLAPERRKRVGVMLPLQLGYNLGRLAGYSLIGALVGLLGETVIQAGLLHLTKQALYAVSALMMIALGLYLGGWWRGLNALERLGGVFWRRLEPIGRRLLPVRDWRQAVAIGLVWAWLPCGLVYSMLILAMSTGSVRDGALVMLAFGLGTLPTLLGIGLLAGAAARFAASTLIRRFAGLVVLGFGFVALWHLFAGG
jgi:sulfite exporter TauE/SafE